MDLGLKGKVALVTGASKSIGLAIAQALAREGARVAIASRSRDRGDLSLLHPASYITGTTLIVDGGLSRAL